MSERFCEDRDAMIWREPGDGGGSGAGAAGFNDFGPRRCLSLKFRLLTWRCRYQ